MNETTLWGGGALEGRVPVVRKVVTLPESGFRLGTWVAPAAFGGPRGGTIPVLDASSTDVLVSVGLSRHGIPVARIRLGSQDVHLLGAVRVPEQTWTRLELVVDHNDQPGTALEVSLWVDDVEVDRAWLTDGLPADCCERTVDVAIGGQGDNWFGWFVGMLGTVWLGPPTAPPSARPNTAPDDARAIPPDSNLEVATVDEIATLRAEPVPTVLREEDTLAWDAGASWELETTLVLPVGSRASLCLRGGAARLILERSAEQTLTCTVHRSGAAEPGRTERTCNLRVTGDETPLHVLVDDNVVEAFVAGQVITTRARSTGHTFETATLRCARAELPDVRVHRLDPAPAVQDWRPRTAPAPASLDAVRRSPGAGRGFVV